MKFEHKDVIKREVTGEVYQVIQPRARYHSEQRRAYVLQHLSSAEFIIWDAEMVESGDFICLHNPTKGGHLAREAARQPNSPGIGVDPGSAGIVDLTNLSNEARELRKKVGGLERDNQILNAEVLRLTQAGSMFQVGGKYYEEASLPIGSSATVEGMKWLDTQLDRYKAAGSRAAELFEENQSLKQLLFVTRNRLTGVLTGHAKWVHALTSSLDDVCGSLRKVGPLDQQETSPTKDSANIIRAMLESAIAYIDGVPPITTPSLFQASPDIPQIDRIPEEERPLVRAFLVDVIVELSKAREKHPSPNPTVAAIAEETGELAQAVLMGDKPGISKEATQTAAMALRIFLEGDPFIDQHRAQTSP